MAELMQRGSLVQLKVDILAQDDVLKAEGNKVFKILGFHDGLADLKSVNKVGMKVMVMGMAKVHLKPAGMRNPTDFQKTV